MYDMQRTPENGNAINGEAKIGSVRGHCCLLLTYICNIFRELNILSNLLNSYLTIYFSQDMTLAVSNVREPESEGKPQKSLNEKQQVSGFIDALNNLNLNLS